MSDPKHAQLDSDLFPDGLFSHLSPEEICNVKDLILGSRVEEMDIDLDRDTLRTNE